MDYKEVIKELKSLHRHCSDMLDESEPDSVWRKDCKALDVAISSMQELQEQREIINQNKDYSEVQKWMQNIIDDAMVSLDEMKRDAKKNLNTCYSPLLYEGRKRKAKTVIYALIELNAYKQLGTLEEVREAVERKNAKKPIYKHYENAGEPPYIKIACLNGCRIQLHPVTDKHLAHEHDYCPKCGQHIDWSEEE